jgi:hypothetical protein
MVSGRPVVCFQCFLFPSESHKRFCFGKVVTQFSGIVKITTYDLFKSVMSFTRSDGCAVLFYSKLLYLLELAKATQTKTKKSYNCMKVILYGSIIYGRVAVNCDPGRKIASLLLV